jgi:formylglycine-generating enzyme required for sulfatase activity
MKKNIIFLLSAIFMLSFSGRKGDLYRKFDLKRFEKALAYIPKGSFNYGASDQDAPADPFSETVRSRTVTVDAFYMSTHEVSNGEYLLFVLDLKEHDTALYRSMLPDTLVWREKLSYNEPYVEYYFRHPAYRNYPVVGVTHEQAEQYCKWLTGRYGREEKRKFKTAVFRLPSTEQWTYAATGGIQLSPFPWGGPYMQNKKGEWLANFSIISQNSIGRVTLPVKNVFGNIEDREILIAGSAGSRPGIPGKLNDAADITVPVLSYYPNDWGLYNMAGNVEEYVAQKGITKGGSWKDTGYYLQNQVEEKHDSLHLTSSERGFRFIMEQDK